MSDMRLIVAGAGGRMGRTLIHAIAAMDGAILAGADYLVVGRPILEAPDPKAAAEAIVAEIGRARPQ